MQLNYKESIDFIKGLYPGKSFIPLHEPVFFGNEKQYLLDTIDSTFVSSVGRYVDRFEDQVKEYTGSKYAIAVVNGTAALHISLILAGVRKNDLVITQALSFIATCNAISYTGACPAFIDVNHSTLGMSAVALEKFLSNVELQDGYPVHKILGKRIGACVPMHTFGFSCEIDNIIKLCDQFNIPVIEDAAEAIGTFYKNQHVGTFGKLGTFSFNGNKTITCGGGGMIVTDNDELGKMAKHLTTQAKVPHKWEFNHDHIGYNYRCPNLNAALACAQMEQLEKIVENKRNTAKEYSDFFQTKEIVFNSEPDENRSNYWLNSIMLPSVSDRELFLEETNSNGVMTRPVWRLLNKLPMFFDCWNDGLENSLDIESKLVNIPSSYR